ncbi:MAG TPA: class I SAM-dependent methyltransferase [Acidimicrobiales bacterium]
MPADTTAPSTDAAGGDRRGWHLEILLVSFAGLLLEIAYTRVISFKLFYYYTYFVLGLALLGIGCGGVVLAVSRRLRSAATDTIVVWGAGIGAVSVVAGYAVVASTPIATRRIWDYGSAASAANAGLLLVVCAALFASFVSIGVIVATLFARQPHRLGRLYFADLAGAALACALVVPLLDRAGASASVFLAGLVLASTALVVALRRRRSAGPAGILVAVAVCAGVAAALVVPAARPDPTVDRLKQELGASEPAYSAWSPIFRVDALELFDRVLLYHDGLPGSAIYPFDGNVESLGRFASDVRSLPFAPPGRAPRDVMIVGAAGGHEILASLYFGAEHVDAVELNPVTYSLLTDRYAGYAGNVADHPSVDYTLADGRSFLARSDESYDLVWFPAPDSYAAASAASASAFVLSESYLYTQEAIIESLERLAAGGVLAAQFGEVDYEEKPNRTARYVSTARAALEHLGVGDPTSHVLVSTSPTDFGAASVSTILVKVEPFTDGEVGRFAEQVALVEGARLRHASSLGVEDGAVSAVLTTPRTAMGKWLDEHPFDVSPVRDDSPFFWHFSPFADVVRDIGEPIDHADLEVAAGERVLLLLLAIAAMLAALFLLAPFVLIRDVWRELPRKRTSATYFGALGLGFMFFEITLIQRLTLFLGYPTYSLTVTLASMLLSTGFGALASERFGGRASRVVVFVGAAVAAIAAFSLFVVPSMTAAMLGSPLWLRVIVAVAIVAPLGVCLGMFMPLGLRTVAAMDVHPREYVAWSWAVNGFASVVGATLTTVVAMTFGFRVVLVLAVGVYAVAIAALRSLDSPR